MVFLDQHANRAFLYLDQSLDRNFNCVMTCMVFVVLMLILEPPAGFSRLQCTDQDKAALVQRIAFQLRTRATLFILDPLFCMHSFLAQLACPALSRTNHT
jgi:hypothetical protein